MTDEFKFWTTKAGPDGLTRISVRASGRGRHESWVIASEEAERDILKRWAAFHLDGLRVTVGIPREATHP